jgi:hypothetical protein
LMSDNDGLSDAIRKSNNAGRKFAFDRWAVSAERNC